MEALQYIYTSWKNGDSSEKGYMIYSTSVGITDAECTAIKDAMQYLAPKELNLTPTAQEIADVFPYAFSYFLLPTGRACVAQSTYLGKDYSGRFGNYIIYAMVFDPADLPCRPAEFFAEPYIKTAMTQEELDAPSPVPPLPPLRITEYGSVINDDQLNEFLFDKEDEFAQLISLVLAARDARIPFYLNDTRENLVLWSAALQRILPLRLAGEFTFNTYIGDHEAMRSPRIRDEGLDFHLIGVRPDANYFNYATESRSNRHMVMDFLGGNMTQGVEPSAYAQAMASSLTMDFEEIDSFGEFIEETSFREISGRLQDAYLYYRLVRFGEFEFSEEALKAILAFGARHCSDADNSDVGSKLLLMLQESGQVLTPQMMGDFWCFVCKYANFMIFTLFDLLQETLYQHSGDAAEPCKDLQMLIQRISRDTPAQYQNYLEYLDSVSAVDQLQLYLSGHRSLYTNEFYLGWLMEAYTLPNGLDNRRPICKLLRSLLNNICRIDNSEKCMVELLFAAMSTPKLFEDVLLSFTGEIRDPNRFERLCVRYVEVAQDIPDRKVARFEQMLFAAPGGAPIATRLCARKIAASRKPEEEFWRFYQDQLGRVSDCAGFSIDPMVMACLNAVDASKRTEAAVEMLRKLDVSLLRDPSAIRQLTDQINECSVKTLAKMEPSLLKKACRLRTSVGRSGMDKTRAVYIGELLERESRQRNRPLCLSTDYGKLGLSLATLQRSDYEAYIKNYFGLYFDLISVREDIQALMQIFYNDRLFADFVSDYLNAVRKLEKRERERCLRLLSWTCFYVITAPRTDAAAEALYKPLLRSLRSLNEDTLSDLHEGVAMEVPPMQCEQFFEEVRRKEGFSGKIGGFFHRK